MKSRRKNQSKNDYAKEVAKSLWDDYHRRTAAYANQLRKEVEDLKMCFNIEDDIMEQARIESMEETNEAIGQIV